MASPLPTPRQLEFMDWELGLFLHFGIRTFYEGHRDWDGKAMSPSAFNPALLDCDQWMAVAREAGMRYAVLTAKHHDGFANWPSAYTDFSVAGSPWRNGKGDIVREFIDAARRQGVEPGLYYSPAQWGEHGAGMTDAGAYDDYFIGQIAEILDGYGDISLLWFDGCGSKDHQYDWSRIVAEIRRMQPNVLIFNMGDPDHRWIGNEAGIAPAPVWNVCERVPFCGPEMLAARGKGPAFLPAECDCMLRERNWFFEQSDQFTIKSVEELMGMYDLSVGRGANLLINVGPDRRGLLPDGDARRLLDFGRAVRKRFARAVATLEDFRREDADGRAVWAADLSRPRLVNTVVLQEDLSGGQRIRRFAVRGRTYLGGEEPITLFEGTNPGHKAICSFPAIRTPRIWIEILEAEGEPQMRVIDVHHCRSAGHFHRQR